MPLTRANVETILIGRAGKILALAGLDGLTRTGANPDLGDPIRVGLASLGLGTATLGVVVDADFAPITAFNVDQLLDVATLAALEAALGNLVQSLGKLRDSIEATVRRKRLQAERQYGYGLPSLTAGVLDLGFAETIDYSTGRPA